MLLTASTSSSERKSMDSGVPGKGLVFAYYVTGHGLGHATRVIEVTRHLIIAGHTVFIVSAAPEYVFRREIDSDRLHVRNVLLDSGAVQKDALTVDRLLSLQEYVRTAVEPREALLKTEVEWLHSIGADLVVSDVVPLACTAASQAGVPAICVSNFSWDFIYSEYVTQAGAQHRALVWQIAGDYARARALLRLPGFCPMPAFRDVVDVPLVVRPARRSRLQVREALGIGQEEKLLLFNFGGQLAKWALRAEFLPPGWKCLVCAAPPEGSSLPPGFIHPGRDAYTPDLIGASDAMLGKIGYGTVSEALAARVPLVFVRRDFFNEEPFLRGMLERARAAVEMSRRDFLSGRWRPYLERALALRPCYAGPLNGGQVAAGLLQDAARGRLASPDGGVGRLRDAIVLGFQMQRAPGRRADVAVPDWYTEGQWPQAPGPSPPSQAAGRGLQLAPPGGEGTVAVEGGAFEILEGSTHGLPDTHAFLQALGRLSTQGGSREQLAAGGIFRWDDELYVARAPGRLDVMGGIADYSGSLVLQMPIREACHVALQRCPPEKQRLWKHTKARHLEASGISAAQATAAAAADEGGSAPSNGSPGGYASGGTPKAAAAAAVGAAGPAAAITAKARAADPSQAWAAYVAGAVLVLMREKGARFRDGLAILVASDVPEGKGVSSSAAVEVATMAALAAAHGIALPPRELAILCQMVENRVVGSPCGVMDQMASACGESDKLLAMLCQPAEVQGLLDIPPHLRFWGVDSGIRHSVGGADYGSVRVGAFMGRRIVQEVAEAQHQQQRSSRSLDTKSPRGPRGAVLPLEEEGGEDNEDDDLDELLGLLDEDPSASGDDAHLEHLCGLPPHSSGFGFGFQGEEFLKTFGTHGDRATSIQPATSYAVRAPTAHPVYEHFRVHAFAQLLTAADSDGQLAALGELMYQSHESYSRCGLGSDGTNRLGGGTLFGAKITGGGCGGTVCVLGRTGESAEADIRRIQKLYQMATGHLPYVFEGSSPGAAQFGSLKIRWKS
eukprot:jgi/Mesen1/1291/ME000013S00789